jgi:hydantoinase/carbamoylase family amidase
MSEAGMTVHQDALATVIGRYEGVEVGAPAIVLGSHIDTVRNAGRYDGALGVLAGIEVVDTLRQTGERLPFAIEVVAFGDEEGVRFPATLSGSRALAGAFDAASLGSTDRAGITLRQALFDFGCDVSKIALAARQRRDTLAYIELHIEQGPVLEARNCPVGVVTAISGASRYRISVEGEAGHAGTTPMNLRHDALTGSCEMILAVERRAREQPDSVVATVGEVSLAPGSPNVIPGSVQFSVELRSPSDSVREWNARTVLSDMEGIAATRGLKLTAAHSYKAMATTCDPNLRRQLQAAAERLGVEAPALPSGAVHDAVAMASLCPIGMLFVRCRNGVSHSPLEAVLAEDVDLAVGVLGDFLRNFQSSVR